MTTTDTHGANISRNLDDERAPVELAKFTMVTTGAMTKQIDRLERRKLLAAAPGV